MSKHKVSELEGALLDWAVGKSDGLQLHDPGGYYMHPEGWPHEGKGEPLPWSPSTLWECGGPIIERESIAIRREHGFCWQAVCCGPWLGKGTSMAMDPKNIVTGETPLQAAMRAYVASKLGDEVEL
jgi:hypothetical protein